MRRPILSALLLVAGCGTSNSAAPAPEPAPTAQRDEAPAGEGAADDRAGDPPGDAPAPAEGARPAGLLPVGTLVPDLLAPDQTGARRTLSEHRGRPIVLYFYPRDATPGCTAEACAFRDAWSRLQGAGAVVYGVSTDDVEAHRRFAEEHELPFSLLSDPDETILRSFGVPSRGGFAARVTFLIDAGGHVARVFQDVDPGVHADEVVAAIETLPEVTVSRARIAAAVAADDRTEADRALDAGRRPEELLAFFGIGEDMRVAELFAGTGYTAELLARVVGEGGRVYAQNNAFVLERFAAAPWAARLERPAMAPVVRVDRELDAPLPEDATGLDAVLFVLAYHDSVWQGTDRAAMNRAIFAALRPGGVYGIVDHAAAEGHGVDDAQTLHRIERATLVREVEAAGFELADEARFLARPDDAHDWNAAPSQAGERRGASDRFVLLFRRPRG